MKLESLFLDGTRITSRGLVHLKYLPSLVELQLFGTDIDEDAVDSLTGIKNLQSVSIKGTGLSDAAQASTIVIDPGSRAHSRKPC